MKINYLKARNFLSVGDDPIEIDFTKLGNIINIKGYNLDAGHGSSNGAGKSTIIECLVYGLYGKLIKGLSHKEAINIKSKRGLEVEIHWDDYKVIRRRAPDRLQLWKGDKEISLGGIPATDELIRDIIKLNYDSFINIACFGQHNDYAFLSCDAKEKRQIAENLMALDKYITFSKVAKDKVKFLKDKQSQVSLQYNNVLQTITVAQKKSKVIQGQRQQWRDNKFHDIAELKNKIAKCKMKLDELRVREDASKYDAVREELVAVENDIEKKEKARTDLHAIIEKADLAIQQRRDEKQQLAIEVSSQERELAIISSEIKHIELCCNEVRSKKGATCYHCYGEITESNVRKMMERDIEKIKELQLRWVEADKKRADSKEKLCTCEDSIRRIGEGRKMARDKEVNNLNALSAAMIRKNELTAWKSDVSSELSLVEKDLQYLDEKLIKIHVDLDDDPYVSMINIVDVEIKEAQNQGNVYKKEMKDIEAELPYYNFWVKAFGDDGIRAFVINEIIPALNARINYWLQFLMDGRVQVNFNNQLDEAIQRMPANHDPFVYNALSGGEHCRIDLAISQAFAHVMMMTAGACPSIVALDEVGANIDRPGIQAIYKMICELSRDRQVIVITHDPDLLELLSGYDTIEVVMKNGITTVKTK